MKKSFIALSAAAVIGGLGLATSAQAVFYFGAGDLDPANFGSNAAIAYAGSTTTLPTLWPLTGALELNPGSTGNELIVPYYSAQGQTQTMLTLVNTDQVNGKAVKVRFRGAANSDDVLDFTILFSPGDAWSAAITQGADGSAHLSSSDTSCTIPSNSELRDATFKPTRFPSYLSGAQQAANTLEGYVEILNMADIPPTITDNTAQWLTSTHRNSTGANITNALYRAIKHQNGTPSCASAWTGGDNNTIDAITALWDTNTITPLNAVTTPTRLLASYGLGTPTGGLMGSWFIINQSTLAQYSGNDVAVRALDQPNGTVAGTDVLFSPQLRDAIPGSVTTYTADPLLTGYATLAPLAQAQYWDLPDLSSPFNSGSRGLGIAQPAPVVGRDPGLWNFSTPTAQVNFLAAALGKPYIWNEFVNDPTGAKTNVPQNTDWIISQPTRRYFAVVDYSTSAATASIIYNDGWTSNNGVPANQDPYTGDGPARTTNPTVATTWGQPYAGLTGTRSHSPTDTGRGNAVGAGNLILDKNNPNGPVACLISSFTAAFDREETSAANGPGLSPGVNVAGNYCGEVATATWGNSPTGASLTNAKVTSSYISGWAAFQPSFFGGTTVIAPNWLPFVGYSAESAGNGDTGKSYGLTLPHRW